MSGSGLLSKLLSSNNPVTYPSKLGEGTGVRGGSWGLGRVGRERKRKGGRKGERPIA